MEQRPGKPQMPTGNELAKQIEEKFIKDGLPALEANERWRKRSRRILEKSNIIFYPIPPRRVSSLQ